jgi:hypothetical protein
MPYDEFMGWCSYFQIRPYGWKEDDRTAKIMAAFGAKKTEQYFTSLTSMREVHNKRTNKNLIASKFFAEILKAKGGDKLDFLAESIPS